MWPPTKARRAFLSKDGIAVSISIVALLVSMTNSYFSFFRRIDDVRVVLKTDLPSILRDDSGAVIPDFGVRVTFVNAGTRTAAVLQVLLVIQQAKASDGERRRTSCDDTIVGYFYDFEPVVIKPGEIVTTFVKLVKGYSSLNNVDDDTEVFVSCMRFGTVNPDSDEQVKDIPIASQDAGSLNVIWEGSAKQPIAIMEGSRWWP